MGDPDVFPQTVSEFVLLVAVRALVHVGLGTVLDEGGRRLEVGLPADDARDAGLVHPREGTTSVSALAMRGGVCRMMAPGGGMSVLLMNDVGDNDHVGDAMFVLHVLLDSVLIGENEGARFAKVRSFVSVKLFEMLSDRRRIFEHFQGTLRTLDGVHRLYVLKHIVFRVKELISPEKSNKKSFFLKCTRGLKQGLHVCCLDFSAQEINIGFLEIQRHLIPKPQVPKEIKVYLATALRTYLQYSHGSFPSLF